jgi:hypothetical protein
MRLENAELVHDEAGQLGRAQARDLPYQDHRRLGGPGLRQKSTEIGVCGHDDPILACGTAHDRGVRGAGRLQVADAHSVIPGCGQQPGQAGREVLVDQESDAGSRRR